MIANGMAWLASRVEDSMSESIAYSRATSSGTVTATLYASLGRNPFTTVGGPSEPAMLSVDEMDFLIRVASLILDGEAVEPKRGDRIGVTISGVAMTFEVKPDRGMPEFSHDPHKTTYRVHCKRIA